MSDPLWLVRAMDAIQRVLALGVKVHRPRTHRVARTAFDIVRKRAEPPLLTFSRRPSRPLFLAADRGHAGPGLTILAYDCAIADRPAFGQHVVNVASIGIDKDRAWRFLAVVWNDLTLIGGWNRRLLIGRVRQLLPIPRGEICVPLRRPRCLHASAEQQSRPSRYDYDDLHDADPLVLGTRTGRPGDAPIPLCLCKTPAFAIPLPAQSPGNGSPTICRLSRSKGSNVVGQIRGHRYPDRTGGLRHNPRPARPAQQRSTIETIQDVRLKQFCAILDVWVEQASRPALRRAAGTSPRQRLSLFYP